MSPAVAVVTNCFYVSKKMTRNLGLKAPQMSGPYSQYIAYRSTSAEYNTTDYYRGAPCWIDIQFNINRAKRRQKDIDTPILSNMSKIKQ